MIMHDDSIPNHAGRRNPDYHGRRARGNGGPRCRRDRAGEKYRLGPEGRFCENDRTSRESGMTSEQKKEPKLISASRRTDIPRFYARWFGERRRQGFAESRTTFGVAGRVSLRRADVLGFLFWTRDAGPFMKELEALRVEGIPYAFQFTINGYGRELEPRRPGLAEAIESFLAVSASLERARVDPMALRPDRGERPLPDIPSRTPVRGYCATTRGSHQGRQRVVRRAVRQGAASHRRPRSAVPGGRPQAPQVGRQEASGSSRREASGFPPEGALGRGQGVRHRASGVLQPRVLGAAVGTARAVAVHRPRALCPLRR